MNVASVEAPNHIYANGKGSLSEASMASALGEYIERLQTNNFFIDFYLPNRKYYPDEVAFEFDGAYLNEALQTLYNPDGEMTASDLVDYNSDYTDKVVALPFIRQSNGEQTYIPINILSNLYVSNGLATGNTPEEAQVQALSEIFERHAKIEIIKNGYALPAFPDALVASFPKLQSDVKAFRNLGYIIEVPDASLGGKYPMTAISLINPKNEGKHIRDMVLNSSNYSVEDILSTIESLDNTLDVGKYIGVIFENSFTMLTFKAQIYLLLGDFDLALELLEVGDDKVGHVVAELIHMSKAKLTWKEYSQALFNIFTEERVMRAVAIFNNEAPLIDLTFHHNYYNMLAMYDRLEVKKV